MTKPSVLNLKLENTFAPQSILENSIGFQTVNGTPLTGTMNIGLTNLTLTPTNGTATVLTSANASTLGKLTANGASVNVAYSTPIPSAPEITMVANAEGEDLTIAPNTWVEVKGRNLAPAGDSRIWGDSDFSNNKMPTTPAAPGETVLLYTNGFGPTSTPVVSGAVTQSGALSPLPVVKIGGVSAVVKFAGLVFPGEFQFNVVVPLNVSEGDQSVTVTYNGATTQVGTLLTFQR